MSNYKNADATTQWFQDNYPGATMTLNEKTMVLCIHTTETTGWPTYSGGASAPTYTGLPPIKLLRRGKWRAHFPDEKSARALQNDSGGVETNTLNVVQLELIGTCDPRNSKSWGGKGVYIAGKDYVYWPNANNRQLKWLARIVADFHKRHGLRLFAPRKFIPYPSSYGQNGVRLTGEQWRKTAGIVGHQHVPENDHGDPGNINIDKVLEFARKMI